MKKSLWGDRKLVLFLNSTDHSSTSWIIFMRSSLGNLHVSFWVLVWELQILWSEGGFYTATAGQNSSFKVSWHCYCVFPAVFWILLTSDTGDSLSRSRLLALNGKCHLMYINCVEKSKWNMNVESFFMLLCISNSKKTPWIDRVNQEWSSACLHSHNMTFCFSTSGLYSSVFVCSLI